MLLIPPLDKRSLKGDKWIWYLKDFGLPMAASLGNALLSVILLPISGGRIHMLVFLASISLFVMISAIAVSPVTGSALVDYFMRLSLAVK